MSPLFSIIVPVYNVAPYLRECLDSVLAQTCGDWECICVDDGSSDESGSILDGYAENDSRFRIFHQRNAGVSAARNHALAFVKGEWILFLDGDDLLHPGALSTMSELICGNQNADVLFGTCVTFTNQLLWPTPEHEIVSVYAPDDHVSVFGATDFIGGRFLVRSEIGTRIRFQPYRTGEDRVYMFSSIVAAKYVVVSNHVFGAYRQRPDSASHREWTVARVQEQLRYCLECIEIARSTGISFLWQNVEWMNEILQWLYGGLAIRLFRGEERASLIDFWNLRASIIAETSGSPYYRIANRICSKCRFRFCFLAFIFVIPRVLIRMKRFFGILSRSRK